jgi:purine nucleosidase
MAVALDPAVATRTNRCYVAVETGSELCRGQSVVDHLHLLGRPPNAVVVVEASRERFLRMLFGAVAGPT